ncbi:MAG: hypothetical protein IPJ79_14135 [Bacteroidetes bacterium]|nr:hypothetical protein [Bacteroidota bacterium]HNU33066.1 hypothetical protein [Bacteroidia bacterium]
MNTKKLSQLMLMLTIAGAVAISGCKKDKDEPDTDTDVANDNSFAERTYDDVKSMSDQAGDNGSLSTYRVGDNSGLLSSCATITNDTTVNPHILTIDFGATNCLCNDGKNRRGKIIISYQGAYRDSGSTHSFSFDNYFVNDYKVLGTKTVTNLGHNSNNQLVYSVAVNGSIINPSGQTMTWSSQRTRTWVAGETTLGVLNDEYDITGSANGTSFAGTSFTATITSALHVKFNCFVTNPGSSLITNGTFDLVPSGKATRTFDFGTGACDNLATVTINGNTYNITLR